MSTPESLPTATVVFATTSPNVSVIMPAHNSAATLREAVGSVIHQTFSDWELVVVDDGSRDDSPKILEELSRQDPRIRVFRESRASGVAAARNRALSEAKGRYVAFLDSDDAWLPHKLETQIREMRAANAALSSSAFVAIDRAGNIIGEFRPRPGLLTYRSLLGYNRVGTLTTVLDRSLCGDVRFKNDLPQSEDYQLWLSILKRGLTGICLPDILAKYRVHGGTLSSNKLSVARARWRVYREFEQYGVVMSAIYSASYTIGAFLKMVAMRRQQLFPPKQLRHVR